MKNCFFENPKLKGILIGGPIPTKDEFVEGDYLTDQLQQKIISVQDQGDTSESGLHELVELSQEVLASQEIIHEKKILDRFFESLGKTPEMTPYKIDEVKKALDFGAVDVLIISKDFDKKKAKELIDVAENMGTSVEVASRETEEGEQFFSLGGLGAMLRFRV